MNNQSAAKNRPRPRLTALLIIGLLSATACLITITINLSPSAQPAAIAPVAPIASPTPSDITRLRWNAARGYTSDWWQVYFNEPGPDLRSDGLDVPLATAIAKVQNSLDIAAFEMNHELIAAAIMQAHQRGVAVRIVTDNEHGLGDEKDDTLRKLKAAGVPVVDDGRSLLMHNKFMILDGASVWTGSWNYTFNDTYRNNNNVLVIESPLVAAVYQDEFNEMFTHSEFGITSTDSGLINFTERGADIRILFAAEGNMVAALTAELEAARHSIRFMTFVFSLDVLGQTLIERLDDGMVIQGIFENRNSTATWSQLPALYCAGAEVRQDGNPYILHHKVFIIDDDTVITGSLNFSNNAVSRNDENVVIIRHPDIARLYLDEWQGLWESAKKPPPEGVTCH